MSSFGSPSGRRRRVEGGRRYAHQVRVTAEEEARLVARASAAGVSVPRLMVEAAVADGQASATELRELGYELVKLRKLAGNMANNVNQVTVHAHVHNQLSEDTEATLAAARKVYRKIDETVEAVIATLEQR